MIAINSNICIYMYNVVYENVTCKGLAQEFEGDVLGPYNDLCILKRGEGRCPVSIPQGDLTNIYTRGYRTVFKGPNYSDPNLNT